MSNVTFQITATSTSGEYSPNNKRKVQIIINTDGKIDNIITLKKDDFTLEEIVEYVIDATEGEYAGANWEDFHAQLESAYLDNKMQTSQTLKSKSIKELVAIYNEIPNVNKVFAFSSEISGKRMIFAAQRNNLLNNEMVEA